jgi:hypothetical protein
MLIDLREKQFPLRAFLLRALKVDTIYTQILHKRNNCFVFLAIICHTIGPARLLEQPHASIIIYTRVSFHDL